MNSSLAEGNHKEAVRDSRTGHRRADHGFTDDKALTELCGQINLLLLDRQKMKADFRKQEIASKRYFPIFRMISRRR